MRARALRSCGCRTERLQPSLLGSLDDAELSRIKRVLIAAQVRNMQVILSPHNFGRYYLRGMETLIGCGAGSLTCRLKIRFAEERGVSTVQDY
jgi:hypothetical protein